MIAKGSILGLLGCLAFCQVMAWGQSPQSSVLDASHASDNPTTSLDFEQVIEPLLAEHCFDCHAGQAAESGLELTSMLEVLRGGDSGEPTLVPGNSQASHLLARLTSTDESLRMPPDGRLGDEQIELIRRWIDDASGWQAAAQALADAEPEHWSFLPLERPSPTDAELQPIDSFITARLASEELGLSVTAQRSRLIRRLYLVMHGLLPTAAQVQAFVHDDSSDAWSQLVEEVLNAPHYGERMASFWLDVVRFGETNGFETNRERPNAYHYRDWVLEAFNQDMPYDRFVMAQLVGDQLGEPRGTGFLVAGPNDIVKGQDALLGLMQRQDELTDIVHATGTTFLGLTTGCARCHNHKFDPISQVDFYALQAVFAGVEHSDAPLPADERILAKIAELEAELEQLRKELEPWQRTAPLRAAVTAQHNEERFPPIAARFIRFEIAQTNSGEPCLDELEIYGADESNLALASLGTRATSSGDFEHPLHRLEHINDGRLGNARSWIAGTVQGGWVQLELSEPQLVQRLVWARDREGIFGDRVATDYRVTVSLDGERWTTVANSQERQPFGSPAESRVVYELEQETVAIRERLQNSIDRAAALEDQLAAMKSPQSAYIGRFAEPPTIHRLYRGDPLAPREAVDADAIERFGSLQLPASAGDRERRLALAQWIVQPDNPLTARVIANRVWQFHFGTGIVDTPSDLGRNGTLPSHPELLDWLASELIDSGWSLKHLHRTILLSKTWQQDSQPRERAMQKDGSSRLLWRFPPRRLEAESIRDNILMVSGALDLTIGGPGFSPFEVSMENVRHYFPKQEFGPEDWRRMLYMQRVRQEREATFGAFDCPDASQAVPQRSRSTTPLQALNLLNSPFVLQQALRCAERLQAEHGNLLDQIRGVYEAAYGRLPDDIELQEVAAFADEQGLDSLVRAIFNSNEFLFVP